VGDLADHTATTRSSVRPSVDAMSVRAIADADSWSLSTGLKGYFSCCFSKSERTAAAAAATGDDARTNGSSEPGADSSACRHSSRSHDDAGRDGASFKMVDRRLEADGASVHSTGTDKASGSVTGDQPLADDVTSSHGTGACVRAAVLKRLSALLVSAGDD